MFGYKSNIYSTNVWLNNSSNAIFSIFGNALRHVIIGAELFPDKGFNLRVGYNFRRAEELRILEQRNFSGLSIGFGLKMGSLKFNYSYSRYTLAANTSLFGLTIDFSNDR